MTSSPKREDTVPFSNWQLFIGRYTFSIRTTLSGPECIHRFQHRLSYSYHASWGIAFGLAFSTKYWKLNENDATFCVEISSVPIPIIGARAIGHFLSAGEDTLMDFKVKNLSGNYVYVLVPAIFLVTSLVYALAITEGIVLFVAMLLYFAFAIVNYMDQQRRYYLSLSESIRETLGPETQA